MYFSLIDGGNSGYIIKKVCNDLTFMVYFMLHNLLLLMTFFVVAMFYIIGVEENEDPIEPHISN